MAIPPTVAELSLMVALMREGVMPFEGTVFEQPAYVLDAWNLFNAAENERQREEYERMQAESAMQAVRHKH